MAATQLPKGWRWGELDDRHAAMLKLSRRPRALLFAVWALKVLPIFEKKRPDDLRPSRAIRLVEAWAIDPNSVTLGQLRAVADYAADAAAHTADYTAAYAAITTYAVAADAADSVVGYAAGYAVGYPADAAADAAVPVDLWPWLYKTYSRSIGLVKFDRTWRTSTVVTLAEGIVRSKALDRMPILADALEEAGCEDRDHLHHMRGGSDAITIADWSLWGALGWGD